MTRGECISVLQALWRYKDCEYSENEIRESLDMAIKSLEQEFSGDVISRQAVIDKIFESRKNFANEFDQGFFADKIRSLPVISTQPKMGHWIDTGSGQKCSECREIQYGYDNFRFFCAYCGAKMVEPQESEDK